MNYLAMLIFIDVLFGLSLPHNVSPFPLLHSKNCVSEKTTRYLFVIPDIINHIYLFEMLITLNISQTDYFSYSTLYLHHFPNIVYCYWISTCPLFMTTSQTCPMMIEFFTCIIPNSIDLCSIINGPIVKFM